MSFKEEDFIVGFLDIKQLIKQKMCLLVYKMVSFTVRLIRAVTY